MLFKYLKDKNSDIEEMNKVDVLSSVKDYLTCFEHAYWINLMKVCVKKIKSCLIDFMKLFNDLTHLIRI